MEKNVPLLRFPDFINVYEIHDFRDFAYKIESGWSPICNTEPAKEGEWGSLKTTSVTWDGYNPNENKKLPSDLIPKSEIEVLLNDILITRVGHIDRVGVVVHVDKKWPKLMVSDNMFRVKIYDRINPAYFTRVLGSESIQKVWKSKLAGLAAAQVVINQKTLNETRFFCPTLPEQTKIANFLTTVDTKISQLKMKKELLEQYKKGVMQKLFSQELRFKDENGEDFAEWEEKKIKDVFRFKQGVQCGVDNQYSEKGDNMQRFIRIIDLTSINEPIRYIDSPGREHHIKPDDLFMVRYGTPGLVGYGYEGIIANNLFRIIPVKEVVNKFYYFVFNYLSQELSNLASSSTMPALSFGSLEVLTVPEPTLPEQTKIANLLSVIDEKISHCTLQIEKMEGWKKGLLQGMFV